MEWNFIEFEAEKAKKKGERAPKRARGDDLMADAEQDLGLSPPIPSSPPTGERHNLLGDLFQAAGEFLGCFDDDSWSQVSGAFPPSEPASPRIEPIDPNQHTLGLQGGQLVRVPPPPRPTVERLVEAGEVQPKKGEFRWQRKRGVFTYDKCWATKEQIFES